PGSVLCPSPTRRFPRTCATSRSSCPSSVPKKTRSARWRPWSTRAALSAQSWAGASACATRPKSPFAWTIPSNGGSASTSCCAWWPARRERMSPAESLAEVAARLRSHASYVITGHVDPDPDCLGSMLALAWGLERLGKRVHGVSPDPVRPEWGFLPGIESVCVPPPVPDADALVVLDCDLPRTGPAAEAADRFLHIYNLDHHVTNLAGGTVRYIDPTAAATGEIVYTVLVDHW